MSYRPKHVNISICPVFFAIALFIIVNANTLTAAEQIVLGSPTNTSIEMSILFDSDVDEFYVEYGTSPGIYGASTAPLPMNEYTSGLTECTFVSLTPLSSDTKYYYRIVADSVPSDEYSFSTQASPGTSFSFVVEADPHCDPRINGVARDNTNKITAWDNWITDEYGLNKSGTTAYSVDHDPEVWSNALDDMYSRDPDNVPAFLIDLGDTFMLNKILTNDPKYIPQVGDNQNTKNDIDQKGDGFTEYDVRYLYSYTRSFFSRIGHSIPIFLATGNHESEMNKVTSANNRDTKDDKNYYKSDEWSVIARRANFINPVPKDIPFYTGSSAKDKAQDLELYSGETRYIQEYRDTWYEWTWGNAQFIVLDPYWYETGIRNDPYPFTLGTEQYQWLQGILQDNSNDDIKFRFVFLHHLVGGSKIEAGRGGAEYANYYEWGGYGEYDSNVWDDFKDDPGYKDLPCKVEIDYLESTFPVDEAPLNGDPVNDASYTFDTARDGWDKPVHDMLVESNIRTVVFTGHDHVYVAQDFEDVTYIQMPQPSTSKYCNEDLADDFCYYEGSYASSPAYLRVNVTPTNAEFHLIKSSHENDYDYNSKRPSCPDEPEPFEDDSVYFELSPIITFYPKGDVNRDGISNLTDLIVILQVMSRLEPGDNAYASEDVDVNGNNQVGLEEAIYVLEELANDLTS